MAQAQRRLRAFQGSGLNGLKCPRSPDRCSLPWTLSRCRTRRLGPWCVRKQSPLQHVLKTRRNAGTRCAKTFTPPSPLSPAPAAEAEAADTKPPRKRKRRSQGSSDLVRQLRNAAWGRKAARGGALLRLGAGQHEQCLVGSSRRRPRGAAQWRPARGRASLPSKPPLPQKTWVAHPAEIGNCE